VDQRRNGIESGLNDSKDRDTERNVAFGYCMRRPMRRRFVSRDYLPKARMQHYIRHLYFSPSC